MTEEDEEFQRLEREAKMRRMSEEDDDTQVYKKPWVGLTEEEINACDPSEEIWGLHKIARAIEDKLREKNT